MPHIEVGARAAFARPDHVADEAEAAADAGIALRVGKEGDVVEAKDAMIKQGMNGKEAHLGSYSGFQLSTEKLENVMTYEQNQAANQ